MLAICIVPPVPPSLPWSARLLVLPRVRRREAHRPVDQVEHQEHDGEHNKKYVVHLEQLFTLVFNDTSSDQYL